MKYILQIFLLVFVISGCNRNNENTPIAPNPNDPFLTNEPLLNAAEGEWYSSVCITDADDQSSLQKMKFSFHEPLSWKDSFFEQDSLEFTGQLDIEKVNYNNPYCLGQGNPQSQIQSNVLGSNLSVIQKSINNDSFQAFYALEKNQGSFGQLDSGGGFLIQISRLNKNLIVEVLNQFTYEGKKFKILGTNQGNNAPFIFKSRLKPISSRNFNDLGVNETRLRSLLYPSQKCGQYYIYSKTVSSKNSNENFKINIVLAAQKNGLVLSWNSKNLSNSGTTRFQTNHLDWLFIDGAIHTENNLKLSVYNDQVYISHTNYNINEVLSGPHFWSYNKLTDYMKFYNDSPEAIFEDCGL